MKHLLVDLDSTLCDTRHRWHLGPIDPETGVTTYPATMHGTMWEMYSLACEGDGVVQETRALIISWFALGGQVHLVSGRDAVAEKATLRWLREHGVPFTTLTLKRPGADWGNHKVAIIEDFRRAGIEPDLFLEDYPPMVKAIRDAGVPCFQVIPPYGEEDLLWPKYAM